MLKSSFLSAVFLMAGEGSRFGSSLPKQFHLLGGRPLYQWALSTLIDSSLFQEIILVCPKKQIERVKKELPDSPVFLHVVEGGKTRQESSYKGTLACHKDCDYLLIHDAARPFVSKKIVLKNLLAVEKHQAVNTCIPASDTIVQSKEQSSIDLIPNRRELYLGQTPQTFSYPLLMKAHQKAKEEKIEATCDCSLVKALHPITIVEGSPYNFKITRSFDWEIAQMIAERKSLADR